MSPTRMIMSLLARVSPPQMFLIIVGLAGGTTWFVSQEINAKLNAVRPQPVIQATTAKAKILVCTKTIQEGSIINSEDLQIKEVDAAKAPMDSATDTIDVIGHPAKFTLMEGSPLSLHDVAPVQGTVGFQSKLRPGERAVSLAVDTNSGVAGFITPDSHVDVMVQVGSGGETKTRAILSDVRVVAAGTIYKKQPGDTVAQPMANVTVAVSPTEASKLINGMSAGRIYLTLRSDRDHSPVAVSDVSSLFRKKTPEIQISEIPPPSLPPMNSLPEPPKATAVDATPGPLPGHEVELWQGDKRDVTMLHQP